MFCPSCGKEQTIDGNFCYSCGKPLKVQTQNEISIESAIKKSTYPYQDLVTTTVLFLVTAGLYLPIWFLSNMRSINKLHSKGKLNPAPFIFSIVLICAAYFFGIWAAQLSGYGGWRQYQIVQNLRIIFWSALILNNIILIFQCYKVAGILSRISQKMNLKLLWTPYGVGTHMAIIFLQIFYLQHIINLLSNPSVVQVVPPEMKSEIQESAKKEKEKRRREWARGERGCLTGCLGMIIIVVVFVAIATKAIV